MEDWPPPPPPEERPRKESLLADAAGLEDNVRRAELFHRDVTEEAKHGVKLVEARAKLLGACSKPPDTNVFEAGPILRVAVLAE